ncbi:hypothetical protein Celaphus_00010113 [Cervus elaphus hippelaphus]|uniref:Uncharacterized protein n=1 Tax=Cervus elaphus hippelaphus TaxID=46360 RepID=A0A212BZQ1_CEREH|nr:hypothetical protein Celaphus_00010113 [Cervus elaphus hippelaphus]
MAGAFLIPILLPIHVPQPWRPPEFKAATSQPHFTSFPCWLCENLEGPTVRPVAIIGSAASISLVPYLIVQLSSETGGTGSR